MIDFIGRFHPLVVHLPIGILLLAIFFEWLPRKKKFRPYKRTIRFILWTGTFVATVACVTGLALSQRDNYNTNLVERHQWAAIGLTVASMLYAMIRSSKKLRSGYRFSSVVVLLLVVITGHLGGSLTHGEDYLTASFDPSGSTFSLADVNLQRAKFYEDLVKPILAKRCLGCHGSSRQKGKLRLDAPEHILKGGESGKVIIPGKADESELAYRIQLPDDDEDHMPPREKPQLTKQEIGILTQWIASGASFSHTLTEAGQVQAMEKLLGAARERNISDVPEESVAPAPVEIIQRLKQLDAVVVPVASTSNYLSVNLIHVTLLDEAMDLLAQLKTQLIWLKAGSRPLTDLHVKKLVGLFNLTRVSLDHTLITDDGLESLKVLPNLHYLNLNHTRITSAGLNRLTSLKNLQSLFLFGVTISEAELEALRLNFPLTTIESGNYSVPLLQTDTIEVKSSGN
jgi:uncharacterized membrane protein